MSNTPLPPLDPAFKEQLNQFNRFGEMPATTGYLPTTQPSQKRQLPIDADEPLPLGVAEDEIMSTNEPPMITLLIGQCEIKRLFVDNRCLRNIIFASTLARMQQEWDRVKVPTELASLPDGTTHQVVGKVILAVKPAKWPRSTPRRMLFSIVEADSIYNGVLGMSLQGYLGLFLMQGGIDLGNAILPQDPMTEEPVRAPHQEGV